MRFVLDEIDNGWTCEYAANVGAAFVSGTLFANSAEDALSEAKKTLASVQAEE